MMRAALLFLTLWTATVFASCSICGPNKVVGDANAQVSFPGQPTISCGTLELASAKALIPKDICRNLLSMLAVCRCHDASGGISSPERFLEHTLRTLVADDDERAPAMGPTPTVQAQPASSVQVRLVEETENDADDDATDDNLATGDSNNDDEVSAESEYSDDQLENDSEPLQPENVGDDETQDNEYADSAFEAQMLEAEETKMIGDSDVAPISVPVALPPVSPVAAPA